ncbi:MAG: hypothetical protein WAO20_09995 [Acidobacteriota bacterium]
MTFHRISWRRILSEASPQKAVASYRSPKRLRRGAGAVQSRPAAPHECISGAAGATWAPVGAAFLCRILVVVGMLLCAGSRVEAADSWEFGGYLKDYTLFYDFPQSGLFIPAGGWLAGNNARFRLHVTWHLNDRFSLTGAYDLAPRVQDPGLNNLGASFVGQLRSSYRAVDLDPVLYPGNTREAATAHFSILQNLDRAFLTLHLDFADLYVGRQAIAWGAAKVVNPTDVIAPFAYNELDVEDRIGVDAVRLRIPLGNLSELDAGYVFGHHFDFPDSAFFLRSRFYALHTDFSVLTVGFQENLLAGFDLSRSVGGAGVWVEGAQVFAGALSESRRDPAQDYFRLSTGSDYTLRDGTYLFVEYDFSQAGGRRPSEYLERLSTTAFRQGAVYLLGRHYLAGGFSRDLTPLVTLSAEALVNLTDGSLYLVPKLEYSLSQNVYLSGSTYLGLGAGPAPGDAGFPHLESEFGSYPDLFYFSIRYYF